jgi:hypothetical protein
LDLESTCATLGEEGVAAAQKAEVLQIQVESWKQVADGQGKMVEDLQKEVDSKTGECLSLSKESQEEMVQLQTNLELRGLELASLASENGGLRQEMQSLESVRLVLETEKASLANANDGLKQVPRPFFHSSLQFDTQVTMSSLSTHVLCA